MIRVTRWEIISAVIVGLVLVVGFQTYRIGNLKKDIAIQHARVTAVERSRDEVKGMYESALNRLTEVHKTAQERLYDYQSTKESDPDSSDWADTPIPDGVRNSLRK